MRIYVYLVAALLLGCSQGSNSAATPSETVSASATPDQDHRGRGERFRKMMEEMDTDHDGKLSEAEKKAGFDKMLEKSERFRDRVDSDGDGKISEEERKIGLERFMKRRDRHHRPDDAGSSPAPSDSETPE